MEKENITGIVLAGGKSSRMGTDKSLMEYNGKPLISYVISALKPICGRVVISANHNLYDFTGCEVWPDEIPSQAPMIGIYSCLKHSSTQNNIIVSCDIPLITSDFLYYLLSQHTDKGITVPLHDSFMEPLCGVYSREILPLLESFIKNENFSLHQFIKNAPHTLVNIELSQFSSFIFMNINTLVDFENLPDNL